VIKKLGKIDTVTFGYCGYDGAMIGLYLRFSMSDSGSVAWSRATWAADPSPSANWTKESRIQFWGELVLFIRDTLDAAKKRDVQDLVGVPVELTFEYELGRLTSWRVLTEVL
jgi:hypothetical protein